MMLHCCMLQAVWIPFSCQNVCLLPVCSGGDMQGNEVNIKVQKIHDTIKLLKSKTALI